MRYLETVWAVFIERPNRFIARVMLDGAEESVHVKNTGRCRELLIPGRRVILSRSQNLARKTKYDLIAVETPSLGLVNLDSQIVNDAAEEWLREKLPGADIRREVKHGASRFDFCIGSAERVTFLEVK
ncbi:MAG: DNA/RNA nuclease SfsA, partial [Ruminococcaceae bacterium]|nr:DNA/RNA nuclease SfsA [Oscillospiraceae bacterium]